MNSRGHLKEINKFKEPVKYQSWILGQWIGHFTVVCLVTWPWIGSEAGGDLILIQTSLLFICKFQLVSRRTA